ncbi:uncharacterized protein LOC122575697 [Bombus pyrosoma]|uniref:uncharacterized protein LOC122575697 n=1 Tax=Bombus pyrosoma TaxID=396416 RepID=UPI001CB8F518|nr:uncharacterized protein LOC122575697 [Bombus pyrosoma]XP_043600954.1 uncharacterized protein LOC122575697 [Bombus pyrosoma]
MSNEVGFKIVRQIESSDLVSSYAILLRESHFPRNRKPGIACRLDSIHRRASVPPCEIIHAPEDSGNGAGMRNRSAADLAPDHREYVRSICSAMHTNRCHKAAPSGSTCDFGRFGEQERKKNKVK